jgi:hypothetical protein
MSWLCPTGAPFPQQVLPKGGRLANSLVKALDAVHVAVREGRRHLQLRYVVLVPRPNRRLNFTRVARDPPPYLQPSYGQSYYN